MRHHAWVELKKNMSAALAEHCGPGYLDGADWVLSGEEATHATVRCEQPGVMLVKAAVTGVESAVPVEGIMPA